MTKTFLDFQAQLVELKQSLKEGKQKDEIANVTGPAVAGTGDDSSVVVVRRKKKRKKMLFNVAPKTFDMFALAVPETLLIADKATEDILLRLIYALTSTNVASGLNQI